MTFAYSVFLVIYFMKKKNRTAGREVKRGGVTREQGEEEENCSSHRERPLKVPAHVKRIKSITCRRRFKMQCL
jgi:hypothetical protein